MIKNPLRRTIHILANHDGTWVQQQVLDLSDARGNDAFGERMVLDGDSAVIGDAMTNIGDNISQGCVYFFERRRLAFSHYLPVIAMPSQ